MNKRKKGFTLTELIAVIVILALLALIGIPAYNSIRSNILENQYNNLVSLIETNAAKYMAEKGIDYQDINVINIQELIDNGKIETDDGDKVLDPRDKSEMNCRVIDIEFDNGNYKATLTNNINCDIQSTTTLSIVAYGEKSGVISLSEDLWINENVELLLNVDRIPTAETIQSYKWIAGNGQTSNESKMLIQVESVLKTIVNAEVTTNAKQYYAYNYLNIDKELPIIKSVTTSKGNDWEAGRDIYVEATDQSGSGIYGYYVGNTPCNVDTEFEVPEEDVTKYEKNVASSEIYNATPYYVCVKDKAGNITEYREELVLQVKDEEVPKCKWSGENTSWKKTPVTIKLNCEDQKSGCATTEKTWNYSTTMETVSISYKISDKAGNTRVCSKTLNVFVDTTAPSGLTITNPTNGNWTKTNFALTLAATENHSGLKNYQYSYSSSASTVGTDATKNWVEKNFKSGTYDTQNFTAERNQAVYIRVCDNVGNCSAKANTMIRLDKTAPGVPTSEIRKINSTGTVISNSNTWKNYNMWWGKFSSSAGSGSPIDHYEYSTNCTGTKSGNLSTSYTYDSNRDWQFCIRAVDSAGNTSSWSSRYYFKIDKTAPTAPTTMNFVYEDWSAYSNNTWTASTVYAARSKNANGPTGSTDEGGSGLAKYQISTDGTNWYDYSYVSTSNRYKMSTSGTHTRYFRAVDGAGNVSTSISRTAKIDKTAPSDLTITNPTNGNWTKNNFALTLSVTENHSGIKNYQYSYSSSASTVGTDATKNWVERSLKSGTYNTQDFTAERNQAVYIRVCDNVGNCSSKANTMIRLDKTAPGVPTSEMRKDTSSGTKLTNANVWRKYNMWWGNFSSSAGSGSPIDHYEYSTNCTGTKTGNLSTSYTYDSNRDWQFCIRAVDSAGNTSSWSSRYYFKIDKTAPTAPTTMNFVYGDWSAYSNNTWTASTVYAARSKNAHGPTGSTDEGGSGLAKYQISTDGTNWYDYSYDYTSSRYKMSSEGTHTRYFRAVDGAGNVSTSISRTAKIDLCQDTTASEGNWSTCSNATGCGTGTQTRTITYTGISGKTCSTVPESRSCSLKACTPTVKITGNIGKWICGQCKDKCSDWVALDSSNACIKTVDNRYGNTVGKVTYTNSANKVTFTYQIDQGKETWIGTSYWVKFIIKNSSGTAVYTTTLKDAYGASWGKGSYHTGTVTYTFNTKGTYYIYIDGNSTSPGFDMSLGTITVS